MLAVVLVMGMAAAPGVSAFNGSFTTQEIADMEQWARKGNPQYTGTTCGTVCSELWLEEHRPMPNQPKSQAMHDELAKLRGRTGVIGKLRTLGPQVILGAVAFEAGWLIGDELSGLIYPVRVPATPPGFVDTGLAARIAGNTIAAATGVGGCGVPGCAFFQMPFDGFVLTFNGGLDQIIETPDLNLAASCNNVSGPPSVAPSGMTFTPRLPGTCERAIETENGVEMVTLPKETYAIYGPEYGGPLKVVGPPEPYEGEGFDFQTSGPSIGTTTLKNNLTTELNSPTAEDDYPVARAWICHVVDPVSCPVDPVEVATVPDCTGLSYNACITAIQDAGFGVYHRNTRSFDDAIPLPEAQPDQVFGTEPAAGEEVHYETDVAVDANPADEDLPRRVPSPLEHESVEEYEERLGALGLPMGEPEVLSDDLLDPQRGPNEVAFTAPAPGAKVAPGTTITPRINPPTAPPVGAGGGAGCDPHNIRGFDLDPLAVPVGDVFPFGIFGWMAGAMSSWGGAATAPSWSIPLGPNLDLPLDLAVMQPVIDYLRPVLLIVSAFGLVWMLAAAALKINAPQGDD